MFHLRKHCLQFPHGVLDQYYAKLLQCDNRLLELSKRPFPSSRAIYFDSHLDKRTTQLSFSQDDSKNMDQQVQMFGYMPQIINYDNPTSGNNSFNKFDFKINTAFVLITT